MPSPFFSLWFSRFRAAHSFRPAVVFEPAQAKQGPWDLSRPWGRGPSLPGAGRGQVRLQAGVRSSQRAQLLRPDVAQRFGGLPLRRHDGSSRPPRPPTSADRPPARNDKNPTSEGYGAKLSLGGEEGGSSSRSVNESRGTISFSHTMCPGKWSSGIWDLLRVNPKQLREN